MNYKFEREIEVGSFLTTFPSNTTLVEIYDGSIPIGIGITKLMQFKYHKERVVLSLSDNAWYDWESKGPYLFRKLDNTVVKVVSQ